MHSVSAGSRRKRPSGIKEVREEWHVQKFAGQWQRLRLRVLDVVLVDPQDEELTEGLVSVTEDDGQACEDALQGVGVVAVHVEEPHTAGKAGDWWGAESRGAANLQREQAFSVDRYELLQYFFSLLFHGILPVVLALGTMDRSASVGGGSGYGGGSGNGASPTPSPYGTTSRHVPRPSNTPTIPLLFVNTDPSMVPCRRVSDKREMVPLSACIQSQSPDGTPGSILARQNTSTSRHQAELTERIRALKDQMRGCHLSRRP
ncbi:hypothetical protein GSI_01569 [Ganoderma sinense ZZ0214-1]|uniref:Uncharacterized protein n=1 Tax=Ganoderma sinense ZZ0214-1 TaxID=1077348 RepID=A0A2G8SQ59_9APHY|nr:hypothetical protein GSI_01569 [Ganoderma sinense ZZ0214-1]